MTNKNEDSKIEEESKIEIIIPEEMWETELGKKVKKEADRIIRSIKEHQKININKKEDKT